jgi:polyisoprenoid-binding protein YceI
LDRTPLPLRTLLAATAVLTGAVCGCSRGDATPAPTATSSAAPVETAPARPDAAARYLIDPFGTAVFVVSAAPRTAGPAQLKGIAKAFSGVLHLDTRDLTRSRATVLVDLAGLETHTFGDEALDREVTTQARDALEVGSSSRRDAVRFARFTLRSIDHASERDIATPTEAARTVLLNVTGDLELHGFTHEKKAELVATISYDAGRISRVTVRTARPIVLSLAAYGVAPPAAKPLARAAVAIGDEATITLELTAKPAVP